MSYPPPYPPGGSGSYPPGASYPPPSGQYPSTQNKHFWDSWFHSSKNQPPPPGYGGPQYPPSGTYPPPYPPQSGPYPPPGGQYPPPQSSQHQTHFWDSWFHHSNKQPPPPPPQAYGPSPQYAVPPYYGSTPANRPPYGVVLEPPPKPIPPPVPPPQPKVARQPPPMPVYPQGMGFTPAGGGMGMVS
mmetsp:Transcript_194/g.513  ORF Transcript_194/g.513 Transcript_194/m.513 type:complete len:186 (+) Transcript_194:37-594(+)